VLDTFFNDQQQNRQEVGIVRYWGVSSGIYIICGIWVFAALFIVPVVIGLLLPFRGERGFD